MLDSIVVAVLLSGLPSSAAGEPGGAVDLAGVESVEETTESLANSLLDLSVAARSGDASRLGPHLDERLSRLALPTRPGRPRPLWRWVLQRDWAAGPGGPVGRDEAVAAFQRLLDRWSSIEDVRFKVKASRVTSGEEGERRAEGTFKSWIVGRDAEGRREWLRGVGTVRARNPGEGWLITELAFETQASQVGMRDMFSECSGPAGLAREDPAFAERTERLRSFGAAAADVDGDGLVDLFATAHDRNYLYLNQGDGTFREVAADALVATLPRPGLAPLFLDHDGDGDRDLFMTSVGPQYLFENRLVPDGRLTFRDVSSRAGVERVAVGHSAAAGDLTGDGWPDIVVASYNDYGKVMPDSWDAATNGTPNLAFVNRGDGTFREAGAELGLADRRWSYAVEVADVDDDADLDVVVANDFGGPTGLFENRGPAATPRFVDVAAERGLADVGYGMGVSLGDVDNDGDLDLHVTKMSSTAGRRILGRLEGSHLPGRDGLAQAASGDSLYENVGGGRFRDVSQRSGALSAGWAWGGGFLDMDNDGHEDLHVPNGFISGKSLRDT